MAVACEILGIGRVGLSYGEGHFAPLRLTSFFSLLCPYLLCLVEGCPCLGPTGIEGHVGDDFCYLRACYAVLLGFFQMVGERTVGDALTDKRCECDQAAVAQRKQVTAVPHLSEEDVIIKMGKFRGKVGSPEKTCV